MRALAVAAGVLLAGCASVRQALPDLPLPEFSVSKPVEEFVAPGASVADQLAAYAARLKGMGEAALVSEAARQRRDGGDVGRVRAAMALSLSSQAEETEIVALVDPVMKRDSADPQARAMASFLHGLAAERRRLKESAAAAGTRLREERKALEAQKQRADAMQEKAAQLQQKLDALTEIEKSLSDRQSQGR